MKKIIYLTLSILACSLAVKSNPSLWEWGHQFNANVQAIEYHDNYIYTVGTFSDSSFVFGNANINNQGGKDLVVIKWDTLGNLIWANNIWGSADEYASGIRVNNNNELIVLGYTNSVSIDVAGNTYTSNGGYDIFIAKYNLNGININAAIYGTAGNEYSADLCIDYLNNIYVASFDKVSKYNNNGIFVWEQNIPAKEIDYSKFDSTIVVSGLFQTSLTFGNTTIFADTDLGQFPNSKDIFASKISLGGIPLWLKNMSNTYYNDQESKIYIRPNNGRIYVALVYKCGLGLSTCSYLWEYNTNGNFMSSVAELINWDFPQAHYIQPYSISGIDQFVCISGTGIGTYLSVLNLDTHQQDNYFFNAGVGTYSFNLIRRPDAIYTLGYDNATFNKLGKLGNFSLLQANPTNQTITNCEGTTIALTGNTTGGMPPFTYNWLPITGLNNTNTNSVSFTATSNISYTLTVTDNIGQIVKDTFNIVVDTLLPPPNITSQYPSFCNTMELYANNGVAGSWYQFLAANNQWQLIGFDTSIIINAAGIYSYSLQNTCGIVTDTITIPATAIVTANASSDSVCAGQSVTLSGNGALSYTWTGGVINNVPFNPSVTQTYIVTGTDGNGCSNTSFIQITILSSNNTSITSICANQIPYSWNGMNLDSSGTYTITYTNMYGCDSTEILHLTVSPCIVCVPNFTINYSPFYNSLTESQSWIVTSGTVLIEAGTQVKLDAHQTSYVIMNPGFKVDSGAVFVAQAYNGCTVGAPQLPQERMIANADLLTNNEIVLYPNPTSGMIHIKHDDKLTGIQIFDMVGKLVIKHKCNGQTETNIDLSHLPNGVYHVKAAGYNSIKVVKNN
jgi:hypothetical protein